VEVPIRFAISCFVSKPQCVKDDWCRKIEAKFFTLCPIREGWAKYPSECYEFGLGPVKSMAYFWRGASWPPGRLESGCQKTEAKQRLPTCSL